ncbi:MAG: amidohydrolase family protein [Chloroflexi bacterium]|nr:amidohydrolase family protein [Chloroflexota bacterium]
MIIDCQSHVFPKAYAELLTRNTNSLRATRVDDGVYLLNYGDVQRFRLDLDSYSAERKLRDMDASGVDMSVISVNIPTPDMLDPDLASEGARICNDALAELCAGHPDRFVGLASLPLNDAPAAIAELDRAVDELDLRGVFLPSHVKGASLDAPQFEAFYAHVAGRGLPLVLHPTVPVWGDAVNEHSMIPMMAFMVDTSFAMLRLILGGVMERNPTLKVLHPHVGGVLPYLMGRVVEQTEVKGRGRDRISQSPRETYKRVYLDLVSPDPLAIRYAYDFAGADRLLFGSDHPWVSIDAILDIVRALDIPAADKEKLIEGNARELFRID